MGEADRKMLKMVMRQNSGSDKVRHRVLDSKMISSCIKTLNDINNDVIAVLQEEKEEKAESR